MHLQHLYIDKKVRSQINYRRTHIARKLIPYYIVMNDIWVAHYIFSSQTDNINEKTMYLGLDQVMHQSSQLCHFDLYIYRSSHLHIYNNMILTLASASYKHNKKIISIRNKRNQNGTCVIFINLHEFV